MKQEKVDLKLAHLLEEVTALPRHKSLSSISYNEWGVVEFELTSNYYFNRPTSYYFGLRANVRILAIEKYWQDFAGLVGIEYLSKEEDYIEKEYKNFEGINTFTLVLKDYLQKLEPSDWTDKNGYPIVEATPKGFNFIKEKVKFLFYENLTPKLKSTLDLKFLDSTINEKIEIPDGDSSNQFLNMEGIMFRRMILAKLVGNPSYDDICSYSESKLQDITKMAETYNMPKLKNYPFVFEEVCKRLKNVAPLKDTKLVLNLQ